jgi:hypothetical protein
MPVVDLQVRLNPDELMLRLTVHIEETALKEAFSDRANERIEKFTKEFVQLKSTLDTGIAVQNTFVSSRVLEKVETIGLSASHRIFSISDV